MPMAWTYRLSDFLLFSPETYYRTIELYNQATWPVHLLTLAFGVSLLFLLLRSPAWQGRTVSGIFAAIWIWIAWAYHLRYFSPINWVAPLFAVMFVTEAALLIWIGVIRNRLTFRATLSIRRSAGFALFASALVVYPFIAIMLDRPWQQAEIFGTSPDPTAIATIALLLTTRRTYWTLLAIPFLWSALSTLLLLAMGSPEAWILLAAFIALFALSIQKNSA